MTNAEKIKSMTNEQLYEFICENSNCQTCKFFAYGGCFLETWLNEEEEVEQDV